MRSMAKTEGGAAWGTLWGEFFYEDDVVNS